MDKLLRKYWGLENDELKNDRLKSIYQTYACFTTPTECLHWQRVISHSIGYTAPQSA